MKKIALTGGIGTGKTFISKSFIQQGIPVFYADEEAKKMYDDPEVIQAIHENFGDTVFVEGTLSLNKLSEIVFSNECMMRQLESILHPRVMKAFDDWALRQKVEVVMMESAIIFEAHLEKFFDKVITVNASVPVRIRRIKQRNPEMSEAQIMARINRQLDQAIKCQLADEVIEHEEDI